MPTTTALNTVVAAPGASTMIMAGLFLGVVVTVFVIQLVRGFRGNGYAVPGWVVVALVILIMTAFALRTCCSAAEPSALLFS